jgi:hypothetical protein
MKVRCLYIIDDNQKKKLILYKLIIGYEIN